jgi:hypothetical protein
MDVFNAATLFTPIGAIKDAATASFFDGATYSSKVLQQMSNPADLQHAFSSSVDGFADAFGQVSTKTGADGSSYQWLEMRGSYGGKTGTFEYIKDSNGVINHRYFNPH